MRAIRLLEKLGFQLDKVSEDSHYYSMSKESWDIPEL
jgi:RimJ/RimL family protein N-acetyltransferase